MALFVKAPVLHSRHTLLSLCFNLSSESSADLKGEPWSGWGGGLRDVEHRDWCATSAAPSLLLTQDLRGLRKSDLFSTDVFYQVSALLSLRSHPALWLYKESKVGIFLTLNSNISSLNFALVLHVHFGKVNLIFIFIFSERIVFWTDDVRQSIRNETIIMWVGWNHACNGGKIQEVIVRYSHRNLQNWRFH